MLQCCVCLSVVCLSLSLLSPVTLCIVAKRCVLEQKLPLTAYRKSYMGNRLNFVQRSYQGHVNHCVTFAIECLGNRQEIKARFQRKWPMDYQMVT